MQTAPTLHDVDPRLTKLRYWAYDILRARQARAEGNRARVLHALSSAAMVRASYASLVRDFRLGKRALMTAEKLQAALSVSPDPYLDVRDRMVTDAREAMALVRSGYCPPAFDQQAQEAA